ncbi:type I-E CRISPR-associated protein Cse1/CasA [Azoarcus sp. DN11]|uniref:type I-E CRISPR-associated protein Cse1/CasA n=1 Tax=Azoarcus sp. DN11 TaxID=356837 RepID=UPI000EF330DF|nr:type I-E CRISPR-associated protein Cse1/CasA [Azoarcus sp. DN11]AYH45835.1 type I-E CRISPR-associated protein Cse1/CasA [Azoarcus sp. DN11]
MNLYTDAWIPVRGSTVPLSLRQLLCEPDERQLSLPRDDLELACLQLLISLVQVALPPPDRQSWRKRMETPLAEAEYNNAVASLMEWFDLDHPTHLFMQTRGVSAAEPTPIQKLMVGLPEGNNHSFFNAPGEVQHLSPAATAIALFNQAATAPNFGGGFKGGLRGTPITTLVAGDDLRQTVWRNVLSEERLRRMLPWYEETKRQAPVWVEPIREKEKIQFNQIGLLRGLFWQPAHIELIRSPAPAVCDFLGGPEQSGYSGFNKEKFVFDVVGLWPHLHSPSEFEIKKDERSDRFLAFTTTAPAWTQCSRFLFSQDDGKSGHRPAAVVEQWRADGSGELRLIVGGYRNKQASILQRRHEFFSIGDGWQDECGQDAIEWAVSRALDCKSLLRGKLYSVVKGNREKGIKALGVDIHEAAENHFYQRTESLIHAWLRTMTRAERRAEKTALLDQLADRCLQIFQEATHPYCRNPALVRTVALARRGLAAELKKMKEATAS